MGILSIIAVSSYEGYPPALFYAAAFIGLCLVIFRPYWALLFAAFCLAGRNFNAAVFTRTAQLGAFLNFNDLLLWISVVACFIVILKRRTFWVPKVLIVILLIDYFGAMESLFKYGFNMSVERLVWATIVFPVMFLVGANLVATPKDAYQIYWALFIGAVVAALQHLVFINLQLPYVTNLAKNEDAGIRSISYIMSGGIFLVVSGLFIRSKKMIIRKPVYWFWIGGLVLITLSYFLSMTRTVYVGAAAAGIGVFIVILFREGFSHFRYSTKIVFSVLLIVGGISIVSSFLFPSLDLASIAEQRTQFMRQTEAFDEAYKTREQGFENEIDIWLNSWIIWGVGTTLPPVFWEKDIKNLGAIHHVGLSTYLATFGILGLVVYWLWLPFATIRVGKTLFLGHRDDYVGALALAGMALAFYDFATILSSNHYMMPMGQVNGLIYGAVWGLARGQIARARSWNPIPWPARYARRRIMA